VSSAPTSDTIRRADQRFRSRTPVSGDLWRRAAQSFPQGVSGQAKFFAPYPVFVSSTSGATVTDVDGRVYLDLLMGAGPMLLGHGHPRVVEAVRRQAGEMTNPMMPTELGLIFAERLRSHMPYLARLRFTNTGTEATRSAVRVARAVTGRLKIAKFEGNYHGSEDLFLVSTHSAEPSGPDHRPHPVIDYAGLSPRLADEVVVLPYNDAEAAVSLIDEHHDQLAAVIMEPVAFSSGGGVPASREFAAAVRAATRRHDIVLILDEVLCGLRLGLPGAPGYLGITPDLAAIGKAIGGGLPLAAFGGRADLMDAALGSEAGWRIFQSGTFTENPLSVAAGMATLDVLETEPALERADAAGELLRESLREAIADSGHDAAVTGVGSIVQVHFGTRRVENRRDVMRSNTSRTRAFLLDMVARGVLWPPIHPAVTSAAHGDVEVDAIVAAAREALEELA
jgi:glutamate-1-semialdehyde 2,1-aminomutase